MIFAFLGLELAEITVGFANCDSLIRTQNLRYECRRTVSMFLSCLWNVLVFEDAVSNANVRQR